MARARKKTGPYPAPDPGPHNACSYLVLALVLVGLVNVMVLDMVATRAGSPWFCPAIPGREGDLTLTGLVDSDSGWASGSGLFAGPG